MVLFKKNKKRLKVAVAMSGGVDSSVAAALLKKENNEVVGFFMKLWLDRDRENQCCSTEAENRARKVAQILNIPFYVFDFEKEFRKRIVDYFLKENKKGLTPNPCVACNKEIKFGLLLKKALKLNADYIATGHYARIKAQSAKFKAQNNNSKPKIYKLLKAKDRNKDQSYFLWMLNQNQLKRILFPIGDYTRQEVEKLAKKFKLPFSGVKKSQEICFIPKTGEEASPLLRPFVKTRAVEDFLKKYLKPKPGPICLEPGSKQIGEHQGLYFYTIGQRKRIKLPGGPYYVLEKDLKNNILIVTKDEKDLFKKELVAKKINWILGKEPKLLLKVSIKIRYRHSLASALIAEKLKTKNYKLVFDKRQRAITPGQSVVFYKNQEVLGGGIII